MHFTVSATNINGSAYSTKLPTIFQQATKSLNGESCHDIDDQTSLVVVAE